MRSVTLFVGFLLALPLAQAQSTSPANPSSNASTSGTATGATSAPPLQDPQAVSVLNQAITAAGGAQAISTISDYTATGNITYYSGAQIQGTVTVTALGGTEFRMDSSLPVGIRSWVVDQGIVSTKTETGKVSSLQPNSRVPSSDAFPYQTPLFPSSLAIPFMPLGPVLASQVYGISYNGVTQVDGHTVHDIQVRQVPSGLPAKAFTLPGRSRDVFIDTSSFQIVMTHDTLPRNATQDLHYSNYQLVNGMSMPFTISEYVAGQQMWTIQLNEIVFNTGLTMSSFALQ